MALIEIDSQGSYLRPVLHRLGYPFRKGCLGAGMTIRAVLMLNPMLGHFRLEGRDIEHLALFDVLRRLIGKICAAMLALFHFMLNYLVGILCHLQGMARMAFLGAALLAAFLAQTLWLCKTVTGRRFSAVLAVGVDLAFQLFDSRFKDGNMELKSFKQSDYRIWSLIVDG
jgi:hypothetical protein